MAVVTLYLSQIHVDMRLSLPKCNCPCTLSWKDYIIDCRIKIAVSLSQELPINKAYILIIYNHALHLNIYCFASGFVKCINRKLHTPTTSKLWAKQSLLHDTKYYFCYCLSQSTHCLSQSTCGIQTELFGKQWVKLYISIPIAPFTYLVKQIS